jgi:hypothetical protein
MFSFLPKRLLQSSNLQIHLLSTGSGPSMYCAISSKVMFVSCMEALMPGSRLRSEIDMRLGDNAALTGEAEPEASGFDDCRTGIGCFAIEGTSPPVSSKNGNCSACGEA